MNDERDLKTLAADVIRVQDACNLSGVLHSWARAVSRLRELLPGLDTEELNQHPINRLWASKVVSLAGDAGLQDWKTVYALAGEEM